MSKRKNLAMVLLVLLTLLGQSIVSAMPTIQLTVIDTSYPQSTDLSYIGQVVAGQAMTHGAMPVAVDAELDTSSHAMPAAMMAAMSSAEHIRCDQACNCPMECVSSAVPVITGTLIRERAISEQLPELRAIDILAPFTTSLFRPPILS